MSFDPRHTVTVRGTGRVRTTPDVARLVVAAERTSPTVGEALARAAEDVSRATSVARALGLEDRDIASGSLSLRPVFGEHGEQDVRGYAAQQALTFTVRTLPTVGRLVTRLGEELGAALRIHHMGLEVADPAPLAASARSAAVDNAREQAQALATQAGRSLGEALVIESEGESNGSAFGGTTRMLAASLSPEAGEQEITATVRIVFELS